MRKYLLILFVLLGSFLTGRADLTMELKADDGRHIRNLVTIVHDNKMRMEVAHATNAMNVIIDLDSRDSLTLIPDTKTYLKRTGAELKRLVEARKKAAGTNAVDLETPSAPAVPTGKTEKIDGLDTELYTWAGGRNLQETLWVAKDFPNYKAIQTELAKIDRYNRAGAHRNAQPELSLLPGMVVRTEITSDGEKGTNTLVSVKVEPVDTSLFVLPSDYTPWKPAPKTGTQITNQ